MFQIASHNASTDKTIQSYFDSRVRVETDRIVKSFNYDFIHTPNRFKNLTLILLKGVLENDSCALDQETKDTIKQEFFN